MKKLTTATFRILAAALTLLFCISLLCCAPEGGENDTRVNPCPSCSNGEISERTAKAPSAFEDGEAVLECSKCDYEISEVLPATKSIKVLLIGDVSLCDSAYYLYKMLHGLGLNASTVGFLRTPQSKKEMTISHHLENAKSGKSDYTLSIEEGNKFKYEYSTTVLDAIEKREWDYIAIGQSLISGGSAESYASLSELCDLLRSASKMDAKILLHMPWSLPVGATVNGFEQYGSHSAMHESTVSAISSVSEWVDGIIPVGTAIENAREAYIDVDIPKDSVRLQSTGSIISSLVWCSTVTGVDPGEISYGHYAQTNENARIISDSVRYSITNPYEVSKVDVKIIRLLAFGNSYANDANKFLAKIFLDGGYDMVVIGVVAQGGCNINNHTSYLDSDPNNDFKGGFSYTKYLNGEEVFSEKYESNPDSNGVALYTKAITDESWDIITVQHAPGEVEKLETYSELEVLMSFIKERATNQDVKFVYHMIWKYNYDTAANYQGIVEITKERVLKTGDFSGVISSLELVSAMNEPGLSYEDIHRDYAHLSMGLGRFALGLLWYCYLTGEEPESISYRPSYDDVMYDLDGKYSFIDVPDEKFELIAKAIRRAINTPYGQLTLEGEGGPYDPDSFPDYTK